MFLPVQSLTSGWMEQSPVSQTTRPTVKVDPRHPQHHPHHHHPKHHLTQKVRPDSALLTPYRQHLSVPEMEEGKMWFLTAWKIYQEKKTSGILARVTVVWRQWTVLIIIHSLTIVIIRNLILIINLQSKGATIGILVGGLGLRFLESGIKFDVCIPDLPAHLLHRVCQQVRNSQDSESWVRKGDSAASDLQALLQCQPLLLQPLCHSNLNQFLERERL